MNGRTNAAGSKGGGITPEMFGMTEMAIDTITFSSEKTIAERLNHSLGKVPIYGIVCCKEPPRTAKHIISAVTTNNESAGTYSTSAKYMFNTTGKCSIYNVNLSSTAIPTATDIAFMSGSYSTVANYKAGVEYKLITMA